MILSNYWKWLEVVTTHPSPATNTMIPCTLIDINGNTLPNVDIAYSYELCNFTCTNVFGRITLKLGTGDNELTVDDYNLTNDITSNFTNFVFSVQADSDAINFTRTFTLSGLNNSGSEQTITEIGVVKGTYGSAYQRDVMLAIVKLDDPIIVPVGQGFTSVIEWIEG